MVPAMDSRPPTSIGYKGTARPPAARTGFTARRGGCKSSSRQSRLPAEKSKNPDRDPLTDSDSDDDVRPPIVRHNTIPLVFADNESHSKQEQRPTESNVLRPKSADKWLNQQTKQIPTQTGSLVSTDEDLEQQKCRNTTIRKTCLAISTDIEQVRREPSQQPTPTTASPPTNTPSPPEDAGSERKAMARSIIIGFPRRALESLLLDAALGNKSVMKEVIEWNSKHPLEDEENIIIQRKPKTIMIKSNHEHENFGDDTFTPILHTGLPSTSSVQSCVPAKSTPAKIAKTDRPAKPISSRVPAHESNTDKTIEQLLQTAKRRRELGEEYIPPQVEKRLKIERSPSASPPPPEPRTKLEQPLSFLTKDMTHIPLIDIEAYVNRPISERLIEAEQNKVPGKVKRPMNSFMLYRKAYQHRAKEYGFMMNHQVVSQLCGDSWPLEPEELREQFAEWARIERYNHEEAHPGYKFCPARPSQETSLLDELMG